MSGDLGAEVVVRAAAASLGRHRNLKLILVGDEAELAKLVRDIVGEHPRLSIRHASEVVGMSEPPADSLRKKKDSSMRVAINLIKDGEAEADLLLLELEQAADGYDEYEVWELDESLLRPLDIVEEMLVMAMPFSAMHVDSASCKVLEPVTEPAQEDTTTPFAALREQMAQDK